jgi:hypothetical protein
MALVAGSRRLADPGGRDNGGKEMCVRNDQPYSNIEDGLRKPASQVRHGRRRRCTFRLAKSRDFIYQ